MGRDSMEGSAGVAGGKERGHGVGPGKAAGCGVVWEATMQGGHAGGLYREETQKREVEAAQ
jgi:hypothetical protein